MAFKEVDSRMNLPEVEKNILAFWNEEKIFEKSLERTKDNPEYSFYDGPPFATGTPHYGHIVASTMKDVVPRYWTMRGYYVPRKWGWDCHGLPIENIAEKTLGIEHKKDIEKIGIAKFNQTCRSKVLEYVEEWNKVMNRLGRWADMKHAYKTMDLSYMESVWWVFKQLWDKGFIYEGYRSMHICPRCETTLSQSEVTEGYKIVKDLSVIAKFKLLNLIDEKKDNSGLEELDTYILAWTTTPWTLLANAALALGPEIKYIRVKAKNVATDESEYYILAKSRLEAVFKDIFYEVVEEFDGSKLGGLHYKPLFDFYSKKSELENKENGWQVYPADFVTTEDGTGVVHIAPAFGEDDMKLGEKYHLPFLQHVGMDGIIGSGFGEFTGKSVKPKDDVQKTDVEIIKYLAHSNLLFSKEKFEHSYPHCWRCDTPLLNYATSSWFVGITQFKEKSLELAKKIDWFPEHIKSGRFGKWLEGARDWSISRQRFWASVIPIWKCACGEVAVFGSIDELRERSKKPITKIIFVRHGESEKNVLNIHSNTVGKWPLTAKGENDAEILSANLQERIDLIISSPILRTKQTAEIINKGRNVPIQHDDLLKDHDFGLWNDLPAELRKNDESYLEYQKIKHDHEKRFHFKYGKVGESRAESVERARVFLNKLAKDHSGKTILIVSHGGINAAIKKTLQDISYEEYFLEEEIGHQKISEFYLDWDGKPFDLHKDSVDQITCECPKCKGVMRRIPDVLDTWFDSGSMPYAQLHYPFENRQSFGHTFPADFIAEGADQTRAWFYYLHSISSAIKNSTSFKHVIVNGIVLAEDGKKMSKKLKNYPDPTLMFDKYGADAMRYYLLTSPVMAAENLNFKESEMAELYRGIFRMLWNSYSFFVLYANIDKWSPNQAKNQKPKDESQNVLDNWIISELQFLTKEVNSGMESYNLVKASRAFILFVDNLSNWYIRRSRKRFWKSENDNDKDCAYHTLYEVLVTLSKLMAPFTPFIAEEIFKNLTGDISVHLQTYPKCNETMINVDLNEQMDRTRKIVELGLSSRATAKIKVRQPLNSLSYGGKKILKELEDIVAEEVNIKQVIFDSKVDPNDVLLDTEISNDLKLEGLAREIIRSVQELRKNASFRVEDRIVVNYQVEPESEVETVIKKFGDIIAKEILADQILNSKESLEKDMELKIDNTSLWISIGR